MFIAVIILTNCICMGVQIHYEVGPQGTVTPTSVPVALHTLEHIFLTIYVIELILRLWLKGVRECFTNRWFLFDLTLVLTGTVTNWILEPIGLGGSLDQILILRLLRLMRLLRVVRGIRQLRTAWRLTVGMLTSTVTMLSTVVLLAILLFVYSCVSIEIITKDQRLWEACPEILERQFNNLLNTCMTLFQFVTLDSVASIYLPLIKAKPVLLLFFTPVYLTIAIVLMNLVTAVIVERALENADADKEFAKMEARRQIQDMRPIIEDLFDSLDSGRKGFVSIEDVNDMHIGDLPKMLQQHIKVNTMEDLYRLLDVEGSGKVDLQQFVNGLFGMVLEYSGKASIESVLMFKALRILETVETKVEQTEQRTRLLDRGVVVPPNKPLKSHASAASAHAPGSSANLVLKTTVIEV